MTDQCSLVGNQTLSLILCGVVMCPVCLVGICGNVACAVNVLRKQLKQSVIYYCFMALCISDIGTLFSSVIIIVLPRILKLLSVPNTYTLGQLLTYGTILFYPICMTFQMASSWLMVVMSVTRCLSVISPLKAKFRLSSANIKLAILFTYVATALYNLPRWCELKTGYCYSTENVNMVKDSDRYNHVAKNLTTGKSSVEGVGSNITQNLLHIRNISGETEVKSSSNNATLNMMIPVVHPTELRLNVMYVGIYYTIFYSIFVFLAPCLLIGGCNLVTALVLIRQRRHRQTNLFANLNSRINSIPSPDGRRSTRFSLMASSRRTSGRLSTDTPTMRYVLQASPVIGKLLTRRPTLPKQSTDLNGNETSVNSKQLLSTKTVPTSHGQHLQTRCSNGFNDRILNRNIVISDPTSRKRTVCSFNIAKNRSLSPRSNSIVVISKVLAESILESSFNSRQTKTVLSFSKSPIAIIADDESKFDKIRKITPGTSGHSVRSNSKGSLKCFNGSEIHLRISVPDLKSSKRNSPRLLHQDYLRRDSASRYSLRTLSCASVLGGVSPMGGRRNGINYDSRTDSVSFSATLLNVITISFMICNVIPSVASIFEVFYKDNIELVNTLTDVGNFLICFNAASNFIIFYLFKSSVRSRISRRFQRSEYVPHNASAMVDYNEIKFSPGQAVL